jgi:hypothetical protein
VSDAKEATSQAVKLANKAKRLFAGKGSAVVGAALCELVALHLACHIVPDNEEETKQMRDTLLDAFVDTVEGLVPILEITEVLPRMRRARAH